MSGIVVLCRHGNTFEKGDKVFIVGAREDLPLTSYGHDQAKAVGQAILASGHVPTRLVTGPLKRTTEFLADVAQTTTSGATVEVDERLREFDFGDWSGLTDDEIVALSGRDALTRWQEESIRPSGICFLPSEEEARDDAVSLLQGLEGSDGLSVVVTSNGRLREIGKLLHGVADTVRSFKVKTGHACVLVWVEGRWQVVGWDLSPENLERLLQQMPRRQES